MIKTVSFAPPRASKSASTSGSSSRPQSRRAAPALPVAPPPTKSVSPIKSARPVQSAPVVKEVVPAEVVPAKAATPSKPRKATPRATAATTALPGLPPSPFVSPSVGATPQPTVSAVEARAALQKEAARQEGSSPAPRVRAPRTKKAAIPENLAEQYGAKVSKRVEAGQVDLPEAESPKKRLTKAEREARKQLLRPDEGLMARLQRATTIVPVKKVPKPRGWRFECGRCGRVLHFQTPGALCECGAIAVKD